MKVVIIAGGKGTRLKPYTAAFPKPLLPVGDKPILEIIVRQLQAHGLCDIVMLVGHLGELIEAFFGDGRKFGVNITYCREEKPLGTVGGLRLLRQELGDTFLTINGDTLTSLDYLDLLRYHNSNGAIVTVGVKKRQLPIDFGVVELGPNSQIMDYSEKPTIMNMVSIGVNAFNPRVLQYLDNGNRVDFPDLIQNLIKAGETVYGYVFDGYWLDIGRLDDYERANEEVESINGVLGIS